MRVFLGFYQANFVDSRFWRNLKAHLIIIWCLKVGDFPYSLIFIICSSRGEVSKAKLRKYCCKSKNMGLWLEVKWAKKNENGLVQGHPGVRESLRREVQNGKGCLTLFFVF